ncbi:oligosaccharyl transferase delta subunit [Amylocystis lapponica]|nr:oligosaccharyl transferase delta subunit [Amylocystis lapponica]
MGVLSFTFVALLAVAGAHAATLTLQSPRFTITGPDATQLRAEPLHADQAPPELALGPADVLKLTFQVAAGAGGAGVQPHQTFLRFRDPASGAEGVQPVRVTPGGKAKFELNMARPPAALPPSGAAPLEVSLLLGSFAHAPAQHALFALRVPASAPAGAGADEGALPEIAHTFRAEQRVPARAVSAVFAAAAFAPWAVLVGLWARVRPSVPHVGAPRIVAFVAALGAFEGLLLWYWVGLQLGEVLLYGGVLGACTALAGKQALGRVGELRVGKK